MDNIIYKLNYEGLILKGFYMELIHEKIPEPYINITEELHQKLLKKEYKFKESTLLIEKEIYTIEDINIFEEVVRESKPYQPSQIEKDVAFLSNILITIIEPMMLPSDNEHQDKQELLLKLKEISNRYYSEDI